MAYNQKYQTNLKHTIQQTRKIGLLFGVLTCGGLAGIALLPGLPTGGSAFEINAYIKAIAYLIAVSGGTLAALAGLAFLLKKKEARAKLLYPITLFVTIVAPQVFLYAPGGIVDRYLVPATVGCALLTVIVGRKIKEYDTSLNSCVWKNIALIAGIVLVTICTPVIFQQEWQDYLVHAAFKLQGKGWQAMTAASSLQYLKISLPIMLITGVVAGITMIAWSLLQRKKLLKAAQLYTGTLCIILLMEVGVAFASCKRYAIRGYATEGFLQTVMQHTKTNDIIVVAGSPDVAEGEGLGQGFKAYLNKYDRRNIYLLELAGQNTPCLTYYDNKNARAIENKNNVQAFAIFSGQEKAFLQQAAWFEPDNYTKHSFTGDYIVYTRNP
jgi:hypothetical protein